MEGVRNCDRTEERGCKKETGRRVRGVRQESLCNRSFLLFPAVVVEGEVEPGRGESRFQVSGWGRMERRGPGERE